MNKTSKRFAEAAEKVNKDMAYSIEDAIALVKETSTVKFDATVELHARLGIDPRKGDQQVRATMTPPHGTGKTKRIAAFVGPNDEGAAKEAGADVICGEEEIKQIKTSGNIDFDVAVATPEMMPKLAILARILGPKGIMPNPKTDTVGPDVTKMIAALKKGKISFKNDKGANLHIPAGKVSFDNEKLSENVEAILEAIERAKPSGAKGTYIKSLFLTSSMGPSVRLELPKK
jgi:large subunit ribosomal protein L1